MRAAVAGGAPDAMVEMPVRALHELARLVDALADAVTAGSQAMAAAAPAAPDGFGAPIDGIRWWVPAPEVAQLRAGMADLRRSAAQMRDDLKLAHGVWL